MRIHAPRHDAARVVFDLLERACTGVPPAIMANNYEAAILLLGEFASAAGHMTLQHPYQGQKAYLPRETELQLVK